MSILSGKHIILGITAGIAAYKSPLLVRLLKKAGADVRVVMTPAAKDFVTPLTLSTLSNNPVLVNFTSDDDNSLWNNHVELGIWADMLIIAPATANTLSKMVNGSSDNLLIATYLSAKCPVYFAPAMDLDMYKHPSTQKAFKKLQSYGNILIPSTHGELASGLVGKGRMAEPIEILNTIEKHTLNNLPLYGKKILITAGPTYERIDPVRFIGNYSTGKMGIELANSVARSGGTVTLICGPTNLKSHESGIQTIEVSSAEEMYNKVHKYFDSVDVAIMSAAVADYKPKNVSLTKIKKSKVSFNLELTKTKDILASLGKLKNKQLLIGFALETNNEIENAKIKIKSKNLDFIVLNSLNDKGAGFGETSNKITIIDSEFNKTNFKLKTKKEVADDIINELIRKMNV